MLCLKTKLVHSRRGITNLRCCQPTTDTLFPKQTRLGNFIYAATLLPSSLYHLKENCKTWFNVWIILKLKKNKQIQLAIWQYFLNLFHGANFQSEKYVKLFRNKWQKLRHMMDKLPSQRLNQISYSKVLISLSNFSESC